MQIYCTQRGFPAFVPSHPQSDLNLSGLCKSAPMAASENLLSLWNLNANTHKNLSRNIHKRSLPKPNASKYDHGSRTGFQTIQTTHLRKRWLELKDREHAAQQCNRELLQQFDRAQDALRDMIAATAAMKTLRMEYDLFLEENSTDRLQELGEKTQVYYKQCLKLDLQRKEAQVSKSIGPVDISLSTMASDADDAARSQKSSQLSLELDFKPVRLPTKYGDNGDSSTSRESRKVTSEKRKKKRNNLQKDKSSSQESLRISSADPNSKRNESLYKEKIEGHLTGSPLTIKNKIGKTPKSNSTSDSPNSQSEQEVAKSPFNNSPSPSESTKGEDDEDKDAETQEKSHEKDESDFMDDNEAEDTSPEDEDDNEDNVEEEEETNERDSDDIIVSHPQNKPRVHFTPQESFQDNDSQAGKSDENSSDDVESLLAPQPQKTIQK
ncbi:uncharacterized protein LOC144207510 [Stigmatopora nigra]